MTAFIITKDKVAPSLKDILPDIEDDVGTIGPSGASVSDMARLRAGEGIAFRLLDDDGEVYYHGRRLEHSSCDRFYGGEHELAPLDCFGTPNAGAVIQEERNKDGKWEAIN